MTNLSSITELPNQSAHNLHSYDKLGTSSQSSSPPTAAVALTYSIPPHASAVHHAGSLHKRSSVIKQWRSFYYVLDDLTLTAYPNSAAYQHVASHPPSPSSQQYKRVELNDVAVKSLSPSAHNRPYCFTLVSRDSGKEHLFAAPSEQARTQWIDAITKALKVAEASRRERQKEMEKMGSDVGRDRGEKSELVSSPARARREEVMSGKGIYSNALITSSSSSSLASITHNMSASTSSHSLSSTADLCHSCHSPFTLTLRPVACSRCARAYCDGCAPHSVLVKGGEVDEERRVCNRCHDGMVGIGGGVVGGGGESSALGSRRTTKNGMLVDDMDEVSHERITINIAPSTASSTTNNNTNTNFLPPLPPLTTSTSSSERTAVLLTNPAVEATRELISPAPNPSSPPPSPLSPIHHSASLNPPNPSLAPSRPASPTSSSSSSSTPLSPSFTVQPSRPPLRLLTVKVPESRERDIVVLSRAEIERVEAERRRKGLPDGGARMGSVVIGAPVVQQQQQQQVKQVVVGQQQVVAGKPMVGGGQDAPIFKKPWYTCGCF